MKDGSYLMRHRSVGNISNKILKYKEERTEFFRCTDVVFTYYVIKERRLSEDV
jgi:hypothetical protein